MSKKLPYSTPEGYFEGLQARLAEIPAGRRPFFAVVKPYLALACCFVVAVVVGNFILSKTAGTQAEGASDEEIVEYLIDSGVTLAQLEDLELY